MVTHLSVMRCGSSEVRTVAVDAVCQLSMENPSFATTSLDLCGSSEVRTAAVDAVCQLSMENPSFATTSLDLLANGNTLVCNEVWFLRGAHGGRGRGVPAVDGEP
ncbi:Integrator complex subunit 4 [Operophtera brumata]|uniref:Integrator complex subunit 4 n=1 Tax=Operophtera brumata TaxID=104452 RepID=A0A0L7KPI0_OPEBR|nr:Integrator complex subunit 4 [Operophtera brumata]